VYEVDGILHFCVPNLPAAAARSTSLALTNAALPYLTEVADSGLESALRSRPDLRRGVYLHRGGCTRESLARASGLPVVSLPGEEGSRS
jgi:alanine dehydrogenase